MISEKTLPGRFMDLFFFFLILLIIFHLTFNVAGKAMSDILAAFIDMLVHNLSVFLISSGAPPAFHGLVIDGICAGVGSVLSFVPIIVVMFFFLGLLNESGYLNRVSSLLDSPMRKAGLSGRCAIPLVMGFGCAVPAIMTAAELLDKSKSLRTIPLIPFMSCSAKLPVYAMLISIFFCHHRALTMAAIYAIGIFTAVIYSMVASRISSVSNSCSEPSPSYSTGHESLRLPSLRPVLKSALSNGAAFIKKAFTVIFTASIVVWFLQSFDSSMNMVEDSSQSLLAQMGRLLSPVFAPLGFDNWRAASAVIAGIFAKEAIISTLAVLSGSQGSAALSFMLRETFSPASAFSFMVFCLLYIPCIATIAAARSCGCSRLYIVRMLIIQLITAWGMSFLAFNIFSCLSSFF